ncbi:ribonuclease MRP protein subunit POP4 isoform X2 [Cornus florida]|uniref:ribonuclease MRP protein subunit POP4 isoform X2 n=1 Tax=Cornus florida TaxID=4283 RepID=UPI00289E23E4|nr:ribonuclease MRP protein subunit POP4 isoform X2 [Cornus florida]
MTTDTTPQDQKKRTSDALERRFALAEAELRLQQQKKNKKTYHEENNRVTQSTVSSSACLTAPSITQSSNFSSKKGNVVFSGQAKTQDKEANDPTYFQLSHPVHENLLTTNKMPDRRGTVVNQILHELLKNGDSAQKYTQGSRSMKIDNWILLDNFVQSHGAAFSARLRALQSHSKRSKKHMSMKQHKKCGSFDMPREIHNFDIFKPMNEMWKGYMTQLLKNVGKNQLAQCLLTADLHVAQCKISAFTGISGIMIRETAETFGIITKDNKFRVVPKKLSVFIFQADCWKITLHGDKLTSRNLGP